MKRLLFLLFCIHLAAESVQKKNLLIFLDRDHEEQPGQDFNVSYQCIISLMQKSGDIIVSQSLLRSLFQRKHIFFQNMNQRESVEGEFLKMFLLVQKSVKNKSIRWVNQQMNHRWFEKQCPKLSHLPAEEYKQVAFNFLCFFVLKTIVEEWSFVQQKNGLVLCVRDGHKMHKSLKLEQLEELQEAPQGSIIPALKAIAKHKKDEWVVYLSGHGYPCDAHHQPEPLVSGMTVHEFQEFLHFLDNKMNTILLAYNSCFAGGKDGLSVYQEKNKAVELSFPVIMTSITDAPTYVFGTPSGFKLPPYGGDNKLDESLIKDGELQPFFLQHFSKFFTYAHQQFCGPECMFLINRYKECIEHGCLIYKVENLPMIRYPHADQFLPLDEEHHFVVNGADDSQVVIQDKKVALWYQKNAHGKVYCLGSVPIFVSMFHEKNNHHQIRELISSTEIESFLRQAFVVLDERNTEIVWDIKKLIVQGKDGRKEYHNVHIKQNKKGVVWTY